MPNPILSKTDWQSISKEISQALNSPLANQTTSRKSLPIVVRKPFVLGGAR